MLGLALALACVSETDYADGMKVIAVGKKLKEGFLAGYVKFMPKSVES